MLPITESPTDNRVFLANLGDEGIVGVDHIADVEIADLGKRLIGLEAIPAKLDHPLDELGVGDARGVLHGTSAADGHQFVRALDAWPGDRPLLDQVEGQRHPGGDLQRDAAELALTLTGMAVAGEKEGAGHAHRQVDGVAGFDVRHVHVPAVVERSQRREGLQLGSGADGAHERPPGEAQPLVVREPAVRELVEPDLLRQGVLQHAGQLGAGEPAEEGDEDADRPIARRLDVLDLDSQGVTRLRALDVDRPGLRVEIGAEDLGGLVVRLW